MTQTEISNLLGCSQPTVNLMLNGKKKVSWPLAQRLSELFPCKDIVAWKNSTPHELKRAFEQLKIDGEAE